MNKPTQTLEVWMRGPISGLIPLLQPVAHAILQAREEVNLMMIDFPNELIWERPNAVASVAFHLQHLSTSYFPMVAATQEKKCELVLNS